MASLGEIAVNNILLIVIALVVFFIFLLGWAVAAEAHWAVVPDQEEAEATVTHVDFDTCTELAEELNQLCEWTPDHE